MGTPGEKTNIGKVVQKSVESENPDESEELLSEISESVESFSTSQLVEESTTTTTPEMTVIGSLQEYTPFSEFTIGQTLPHSSTKPEPTLEQAYIEDYYSQTKLYQSPVSVSTPYLPVKKPFPSLEEPGPSGLQTPKIKVETNIEELSAVVKKPQISKKLYVCQSCQKTFQNAAKLAKHQLSHGTGSSTFKCEHCKKTFTSKFKLVRHALIHSDRKPFSCSVCDRTFHRKDHLKNHIKVHSPSKKHYICEKADCKKEYTSLLSFKKHMAVHAAEEGSLVCQVCFQSFETKDEILYHLKVHAGSRTVKNPNEKKFTCDYCDRKFFTRKDVRRHLVVHTGMRDFLCQFCPQRFGRKDHLVRHIKKSHSQELEQQAIPSTSSVKMEVTEAVLVKSKTPKTHIEENFDPSTVELPDIEVTSLLFSQEDLSGLNIGPEPLEFLPGPSTQRVLKDLESESLEEIEENPPVPPSLTETIEQSLPVPLLEEPVFSDQEILQLLQATDDKNLPLPGFSQTFQTPPPQPPPKPPPRH
ncbi:zinc finger protein 577-like [Agrilus planipennis]|uniref:Zinc finger protein 577-like n=1 Tax=Agrilus planipennis TaxID=224129 RepID=A0A1W4XDE1_AGRPL|nr:zinc finger protein 577-like [Agrilus planipennis]XP_018334020.1 zinc finger protein 577-like [Agrilus planipennis]